MRRAGLERDRLLLGHCTEWRCRKRSYETKTVSREVKAACPCRNVREREVKEVIVKAFNLLPRERDKLIREQGALRDGELKRIDLEIERNRERQKRINEELVEANADFLENELEQAEYEETELILERAEAVNKEMKIRLLLELLDKPYSEEKEWEDPACYD